MRTITFKIEEDLLQQLERYAMKYNLDRSTAIRRAIMKLLSEEFKEEHTAKVERISLR